MDNRLLNPDSLSMMRVMIPALLEEGLSQEEATKTCWATIALQYGRAGGINKSAAEFAKVYNASEDEQSQVYRLLHALSEL